jgi:hypothetical protein
VYLHSGTRKGALALELDTKKRVALEMFELPMPLRELAAHEVEDVLCIYKDVFTGDAKLEELEPVCFPDDEASMPG